MSLPVHLVACAKTKAVHPAPAKALYRSEWFRRARAYVEARGGPWFILSAEHGLLDPDDVVAPYEATLLGTPPADRRAWALRVHRSLFARRLTPGFGRSVVFLAGAAYREHLEPWLSVQASAGASVETPMRGLGLGQQLAWLAAHTPSDPPVPPAPAAACSRRAASAVHALAA